jgi:DNA-binding LacI/PurR family transcriptional regulator
LNLDWENFSAITFGFTLAAPRLHVVTNAQFRSMVIAMRTLRRLGHRRIGFALEKFIDERCDHNYLAGFLVEQTRFKAGDRIPPFIMARTDAATQRSFESWFRKHCPEAIITMNWPVGKWMGEMGCQEGKDYSLATLVHPSPALGGIDQNELLTGRTAVDLLVGMIHRSERGIPKVPLRTLIEGSWVGGASIRSLVPSAA